MKWTTVLFTPANRPERVKKAWEKNAADVVVADLEDAVPPNEKVQARDDVIALLRQASTCVKAVRINQGDLGKADLAVLQAADMIVVPKVECAADVQDALGVAPVLAIVETAKGITHAEEICQSGVTAVAFGAEDLAADAGLQRTPDNWEVSVPRAMLALHAAAAGIACIDMITADYQDVERTAREATEARQLGYHGKMCLHPAQVAAVRAAFAPSESDLTWARKVVAAAASVESGGVVVVDGRMIDVPFIAQAKRILQQE